jgi:catechol 2,3-dioxygenase-like lactoylglutathione lyase family enzyme
MTGTDAHTDGPNDSSPMPARVDMKLEVVVMPVSDATRTRQFYQNLGWRLDADFVISDDYRVLQLTPPGSSASIVFGTGIREATPTSAEKLVLVVADLEEARADLIIRGVSVSEIFHGQAFRAGTAGREPGPDPEHRSYSSFASFSDPDGNVWLLQEITQRLPGR